MNRKTDQTTIMFLDFIFFYLDAVEMVELHYNNWYHEVKSFGKKLFNECLFGSHFFTAILSYYFKTLLKFLSVLHCKVTQEQSDWLETICEPQFSDS